MKRMMIVGASSGIGYGCARFLLERGVSLGLASRRTAPLEALADEFPGQVVYESIDVASPDAPERIRSLAARMGGLDYYFHVAGMGIGNSELDPETEAEIFGVNTVGAVRCVAAAYSLMKERGGNIAVLTSVAGTKGIGDMAAYSASKGAVSEWLVALEQRARRDKVPVSFTDIRPGFIDTPLLGGKRQMMEMSLEYAVPLIIGALARRPRVAVIDWRWNLVVGLWRLIPNSLWVRIPLRMDAL